MATRPMPGSGARGSSAPPVAGKATGGADSGFTYSQGVGYTDPASGQYVPGSFARTLDLPSPEDLMNSAGAKSTLKSLQAEQGRGRSAQNNINAANARIKSYQQQLKAKNLSAQQRAHLSALVRQQQVYVTQQTNALTTSNKALPGLQNAYYQASGQYDKLLSGANRDAFAALKSLFDGYGLGTLAGKIYDYVKQGYGADTISLLLQDTKEYKTRFAANDARTKAGLPVLSPADYLNAESSYRQILSSAGLPKGFYDNPADFQNWIAGDVSPTEIKDRVDMAAQAVSQSDPAYRHALYQMYGINESDLTAYFLDRKTAEPILKKQAAAGAIGAAALRRGFAANALDLESYATMGITADQAEQAYSQISQGFSSMLGLAGRYGDTWNQRLAEQEVFTPGATSGGQESASDKGKRLRSQERAQFAGQQGSSSAGLNPGFLQT